MNPKQFFDTVCMMRNAQKDYFKTRAAGSLAEAKRLEKFIDNEISRVKEIKRNEPSLFKDSGL